MKYFFNKIKNDYEYIILLVIYVYSIILRLYPYIINKYYFLVGFDSGRYVYELNNAISVNISSLDLWSEPGLNSTLFSIKVLSGIDGIVIYKYLVPAFCILWIIILVYKYILLITYNKNYALVGAILISNSIILSSAFFNNFYRQIFATCLYLTILYFFEKFNNFKFNLKDISLLSILFSGVYIFHRGISLLLFLTILFIYIINYKKIDKKSLKNILLVFFLSFLLSSVYLVPIMKENIKVLIDTIIFSLRGNSGGATTIRTLSRTDNQITGYFFSIFSSIISFMGLVYLIKKNKGYVLNIGTVLLILYIYFKAVFSNRFVFNLDIFLIIYIGIGLYFLKDRIGNRTATVISLILIVVSINTGIRSVNNERPYIPFKLDSTEWVIDNIEKNDSLIIAPDALSTIFTQMGYKTLIYELELKLGQKDTRIEDTEKFLVTGYFEAKTMMPIITRYKNVYVIFGEWNLSNPMQRTGLKINLLNWEGSDDFQKLYDGDPYIFRVYKLKND